MRNGIDVELAMSIVFVGALILAAIWALTT
jgi:hypothetical protein